MSGKPETRIAAARVAATAAFLCNGAVYATWVAQISITKERLGLSEGQLGLALLCSALGSIATMAVAGRLCGRWGSGRVTAAAFAGLCLSLPLLALSPSYATLGGALFLFGICMGSMDVAMNAQAAEVEAAMARPIMSSAHGFWSVGALAGASCGGFALDRGIPVAAYSAAVSVAMGALAFGAFPKFLGRSGPAGPRGPAFAWPSGATAWLGAVAFLALMAEGEISNWSTVYFHGERGVAQGAAAYGFAAFSLAMALGRLVGDRLVSRWGPVSVGRVSGLLAAAGLAGALAAPSAGISMACFALVGLGLANLVPLAFAAASRAPGQMGSNIAAVATVGYGGLLLGPPLVGFAAEATTLPFALCLVGLASLLAALLAGRLR